jgi:hypothetical protein
MEAIQKEVMKLLACQPGAGTQKGLGRVVHVR